MFSIWDDGPPTTTLPRLLRFAAAGFVTLLAAVFTMASWGLLLNCYGDALVRLWDWARRD